MFSSIKNVGLCGCLVLILGVCGVSAPVDMPPSLLFGGSAQKFEIDRGLDQDQANIQILDDFYKSREIDDEFTNTIKEEIASYGLGYLQGRFRLGLGIGNTFAAISSGFCANKNNAATDFCVFWAQCGLLINLGMLSASSLDLLYAKLSKSYNELPKGSFEGTNQKILEDELDLKGSIVGEGVHWAGKITTTAELKTFLNTIDETTTITQLEQKGIKSFFRGTTRSKADNSLFPGNLNTQVFGISTSTDPIKATIFSIESATSNGAYKGVLQIGLPNDLKNIALSAPNYRVAKELEVVLNTPASNFANLSKVEISVENARKLVKEVYGVDLPTNLPRSYADELLETIPESSLDKAFEFYQKAIQYNIK